MPDQVKSLFAGIDLNLPKVSSSSISSTNEANPLVDTLRVKVNLARAYITIEDFAAAKKSLEEVLSMSHSVDPEITTEVQSLLSELSTRNT
jgi:pilus assembly protein FimV